MNSRSALWEVVEAGDAEQVSILVSEYQRDAENDDGGFDISDAVYILSALFVPGGDPLVCEDAGDSNDDGTNDISDAVYALAALFVPGAPPPPAPGASTCGWDPTVDLLVDCDSIVCP